MNQNNNPQWLRTWQSHFKTCIQVYEELRDRARNRVLSLSERAEVESMIQKHAAIHEKCSTLCTDDSCGSEYRKLEKEMFALCGRIRKYWKEHGFNNMLIRQNGKVGMRSMYGGIAVLPCYEDINFTYDDQEFFYKSFFVVKQDGKWGVVNERQQIVIPFDYDLIFRQPYSSYTFIVVQGEKQGVMYIDIDSLSAKAGVLCEMDAIYHVPGWGISLFSKNGKYGWWWESDSDIYHNYNEPEFDEVFFPPIEEVEQYDDDSDELFAVRKGDRYSEVLYWTAK